MFSSGHNFLFGYLVSAVFTSDSGKRKIVIRVYLLLCEKNSNILTYSEAHRMNDFS